MNLKHIPLVIAASLALNLNAALPSAEQLLPQDTMLVFTVPNWSKAKTAYTESPGGQLWRDPELKAFRDKFTDKLRTDVLTPLEQQLGVKLADYLELLQGQVTLAITQHGWDGGSTPLPGWLLLIDAQGKSDQLKKNLDDLKRKWVEAGKQIKHDKIRDLEFTTLIFTADDLKKTFQNAFPRAKTKDTAAEGQKSASKVELIVGQSDSLLLLGSNAKDLEKVLVRQAGGQAPALAEQAEFQASQAVFRDATGYFWLNLGSIVTVLNKKIAEASSSTKPNNPMMPKPDKLFSALGLNGLKGFAASMNDWPEGAGFNLFLGVPEENRKGLFKLLAMEAKNASPPPFVPAEAVKFNRWRLDGQKAWATIEATIAEISPELSGFLQMGLAAAGKDKDPNFDLKKSLIGNLGDDFISYQKNPSSYTIAALNSPPSLLLIGSPNPEQLAQAIRSAASLLVPATTSLKEREFLGRKIFSLPMPAMPDLDGGKPGEKHLNFAASSGYLAISTDEPILEEYLRSSSDKVKALQENAALKAAAEKVGGMNTGLFGYENQLETMRATVETLKRDAGAIEKLFNLGPLTMRSSTNAENKNEFKDWFDFSLLPPFEKIAKYFHIAVYSAAANAEGLSLRFYSPNPPGFKR